MCAILTNRTREENLDLTSNNQSLRARAGGCGQVEEAEINFLSRRWRHCAIIMLAYWRCPTLVSWTWMLRAAFQMPELFHKFCVEFSQLLPSGARFLVPKWRKYGTEQLLVKFLNFSSFLKVHLDFFLKKKSRWLKNIYYSLIIICKKSHCVSEWTLSFWMQNKPPSETR